MSTGIPAARYAERLGAAQEALRDANAGALLIGVGADLRWLTGYAARPIPRLTMLTVPRDRPPTLLVPRLELAAAQAAPAVSERLLEVESWEETEDPIKRVASALGGTDGARATGGASPTTADDHDRPLLFSDRLWATFLLGLQRALPGRRFELASQVMRSLRIVKSREEIELLRRAAHAADRTVAAITRGRLVGRTEADVAREIRARLVDEGHDDASFWIVASGPNSASPHHDPGDRVIGPGEPIVIDIGGTVEGYGSDITRTIWVAGDGTENGPDDEFRRLYAVLQAAQASGTEAVRPGVSCESIDAVCRDPISAAGYGDHFIHRTGHGIGLEGHEDPYLVAGNTTPLQPGHAFSVEPGIYLGGRYGARIEDIVVCSDAAPEVLNEHPRDLLTVPG